MVRTAFNPNLTDWFPPHVKPVHVGEYNASVHKVSWIRRWWNGETWSEFYSDGSPMPAKIANARDQASIHWRGLREPS